MVVVICTWLLPAALLSQPSTPAPVFSNISFQHLNTSNGLSYLGVNNLCNDQKGNLWVATGNGLNMFDGKTIEKYYASEYPQLKSSNILHVTCDGNNRIWVLAAGGNVTVLDDKRQLHRVGLYDKNKFIRTRWIMNSGNGGIILFTDKGHYRFNQQQGNFKDSLSTAQFSPLPIKGFDSLQSKRFWSLFHYDDESYLFVNGDEIYKVNYKMGVVEKKLAIERANPLVKWGENQLLSFNRITRNIEQIDLVTGKISYPFKGLKDQRGKDIDNWLNFGEQIAPAKFLFTSLNSGMYIYDSVSKEIFNYAHNIADPASIAVNNTTTISVGKKGWVFVTCNPNGISYFNQNDIISNQNVFLDGKGKGYDAYIAGIATQDNNIYYIGTSDGLLQWDRKANKSVFLQYYDDKGNPLPDNEEVTTILLDKSGRIWCTTLNSGVFVINKNNQLLKHFKPTGASKSTLKVERITYLLHGPDGYIWVCGGNGISRIDPATMEVDNFKGHGISKFDSTYCSPIVFSDKDNLWIGTYNSGVFHYNFTTQHIDTFNTANGLVDNGIFDIELDANKNVYVGTRLGMNILFPDGRIKLITQKDGLLIDRAEAFLLDRHDRMWIGNDIGLACYNTKDSSVRTFDVRYGMSIFGFRVNAYFQMPNGEFAFGTPRGMQYFFPDSLFQKRISLNAIVSKIETGDIVSSITDNAVFDLAAGDNQVTFYFGSVDFSPPFRTYYEYKLEGVDKDWIRVVDQYSVRYNSLPAGKWIFKVRVSNDGKTWQDADNEVTVLIQAPYWKTWWFKTIASLASLALVWYVINFYRQKQKQKEQELETELVITYFASQINKHYNTNELLWDVAKNCISQLHFEDCVIYQLEETRNVLVQKAAYGPKNPVDFTIDAPIEIKVGEGIVGSVAKTGKAEIITNTAVDKRYIVDDKRRYSEISVPIIIDNKVVGVIDSEHHRRNFFNNRHLKILNTIATLCASQMQLVKAEEEKEKAEIELLHNKQKALESRLQSLRLQMNPHFLFNALNSVQQMILANEEMVATRYLSRFSKLLRAILVHSDKETITLKEELEILNLYIELESIRFKEAFKYKIICDDSIDVDEVKVPTLLIQPFVENAIWHGLMHKESDRELLVKFVDNGEWLQCIVEDNGVGRKKAQEIKGITMNGSKHQSKGIAVSTERLKSMKSSCGELGHINFTDLYNEDGTAAGTRIEINFPILN